MQSISFKILTKTPLLCLITLLLLLPQQAFARITPADIINSQKQSLDKKVKNYSSKHQQGLDNLSQKITQTNAQKTHELTEIMLKQAAVLDEFLTRKNFNSPAAAGIHRNLSNPIENARYWITYAHEAVAYQTAKIYIFNLTSEANIRQGAKNTILILQNDLEQTRQKVTKSQNILKGLVANP